MRRVILILTLLLPVASMAQENDHGPNEGQPFAADEGNETANTAAQQTPAAAKPGGVNQEPQRPRSEGSMVGYIYNAIIGSQIRIRFDAGFDIHQPDRGEFFYAKCGCYQILQGNPAYDPKAPGPQPGVATDLNFQQLYLNAEYAPHKRFSVFTEVPIRWLQPQSFVPGFGSFKNQSGIGDVRAGFKIGLIASRDRYLTVQLLGSFPSGDASRGLGTNHTSIEPSVLYYQRFSRRLAIESQISDWHPTSSSAGVASASDSKPAGFAGDVFSYGFGPSYELFRGERVRFAPVVEVVGWRLIGGYQTIWLSGDHIADKSGGTDIVNLKMGARTTVGARNSFYIGYGRSLTGAVWYKNLVRFEYRYSF